MTSMECRSQRDLLETHFSCGMALRRRCVVLAPLPRRVRDCTSERRTAFLGRLAAVVVRARERRRDGMLRCILSGGLQ